MAQRKCARVSCETKTESSDDRIQVFKDGVVMLGTKEQ